MSDQRLSEDGKPFIPDTQSGEQSDPIGSTNRGEDTRYESNEPRVKITLEMINEIIIDYLKNTIAPTIVENEVSRAVPVLYGTPERWVTVRQDGAIRDPDSAKALAPMIMLRRTSVARGKPLNPNNKYMYTTMENRYNSRNVYDKHLRSNGITPSRGVIGVMVPDYMDLTYEVLLWTESQVQMDTLIEQINVESEEFWGNRNNYKFKVTIDEFTNISELPSSTDRLVRNTFNMKINAYLIPERFVENFTLSSTNFKAYTAKKVVTFIELLPGK